MAIERIEPGTEEWKQYYPNHLVRYQFVFERIKELRENVTVLDAACGVGYGSKIMASLDQATIIGVDINNQAIEIANSLFNDKKVKYVVDNCETLEKISAFAPFTHIVSFETFEHLKNPEKFLKRAIDLLGEGGLIIISTPNRMVSSPDGVVRWEFHEKEYSPNEFVNLIKNSGFEEIQLFGQAHTEIGKMRKSINTELSRVYRNISFNPLIRLGNYLKKIMGRPAIEYSSTLYEQVADFEIVKYNSVQDMEGKGKDGPFVQIVMAKKKTK